jgi:hypothetical protein
MPFGIADKKLAMLSGSKHELVLAVDAPEVARPVVLPDAVFEILEVPAPRHGERLDATDQLAARARNVEGRVAIQ